MDKNIPNENEYWQRFKTYFCHSAELELAIDISRMNFPENYFEIMEPAIQKAYIEMDRLEDGIIANPDEDRMVGHYWLRAPWLAPQNSIRCGIENSLQAIKEFVSNVHEGVIRLEQDKKYKYFILIGIGGSALGPQLLADAMKLKLADKTRGFLKPYFLDNTDPDGIDRILIELRDVLAETLVLVVSKSGGTVETYNGLVELQHAYRLQGLEFARHALAVTCSGSKLALRAREENWLAILPIWEWVGGRTSITSAVGLLPAALLGIDIDAFLTGARLCDELTRTRDTLANPAALLALMWYYAAGGHGKRDMVILPYKDSLQYLARYLQQLIMESIGKELDRDDNTVHQGLTVYGNKGSTDQHAYVQQLLDGVNNFFVTFVEVLADEREELLYVRDDITSGDYLRAFLLGTRRALTLKGRESITITLKKVDARSLGAIIALFERAVGLYASLVNINAYDQPGVELGKKGANMVIDMLAEAQEYIRDKKGEIVTVEEIIGACGYPGEHETMFKVLEYLCADGNRGIKKVYGTDYFDSGYSW